MVLKILIVDDDVVDRALLKRHVAKRGVDIEFLEAESGQEAIDIMNSCDDIDCVFLDYMLPDQDGIQVIKSVYNYKTDLGPFPIIMLTGQGSEAVAVDAIRYGAQDYLIKENLSHDVVQITLAKAHELFELKSNHHDAKKIIEHSQRMDTVGQLSSGIAHDFNNLLTITFGNIQLLGDALSQEAVDVQYCLKKLSVIERTSKRGADLVKKLMVFSRQRQLDSVTTDMNVVISDLLELLQRSLGDYIDVHLELGDDIHYVDVDPGQLEHAIINMGINARDVMEDGGALSLLTDNIVVQPDDALVNRLSIEPGAYVKLTISDTGTGMPAEVREKVFEPFFTTKDVGKGTGLGLSMVYGFVQESGAYIDVESALGEGTHFHLYFPRSLEEFAQVEDPSSVVRPKPVGGDETILLVEDEDDIRFIASMVLKGAGYTVLEATNGQEGLEMMQTHADAKDIDLVFTDIAMPGDMNGIQMAARVQVLNPEVRLLFTTGYGEGALPDMNLVARYPVVNKPYGPDDLLSRIRSVLDGAASPS